MTFRVPHRRTGAILTAAIVLSSLSWLYAAQKLAPHTEDMPVGESEVRATVKYRPSATAEDLGLPFHRRARVTESFVYHATAPDGKQVLYYASAILASDDAPSKVAATYTEKLPGHPKAEKLSGEAGEREVLAIAVGDEVRTVTITAAGTGSRIELVRASKVTAPSKPSKPLRPRRREQVT